MLLDLKQDIVYGPVCSRRLGRSLGINVLPATRKVCSFNCVYCQYGFAESVPVGQGGSRGSGEDPRNAVHWPHVDAVLGALEERLERTVDPPACLTLSGNGEPTLHPQFPAIVDGVIGVRDRLAPSAKIALLSNSSRVTDVAVRAAVSRLDVRVMKLDAGLETVFQRYNQPSPGIRLADIVAGLRSLGGITIQTLFTGGLTGNLWQDNLEAWVEAVAFVAPRTVQLSTLDRKAPSPLIRRASRTELDEIKGRLAARGVPAETF